jgi:glycerol-3-phosphate acyltransferase PlsX
MGGDHAPQANLEGAQQALPELEGELILIGDEKVLKAALEKRRYRFLKQAIALGESNPGCVVRIIHASENIEMDDTIRAIRAKPNATINIGCRMAAEDWDKTKKDRAHEPSAFISAGHSGAMMASALLNMGRLKGAERPAIAVKLPSLSPDGCVVLDVGANVDCKPEHLRDFAIMGALFAQVERKTFSPPRVGILSNGEERSKGNELTRAALELIEALPVWQGEGQIGKFVGYSEGKEMFKGQVDVVVCDGFVGNVVLKSVEGVGSAVVQTLKREAKVNPLNLMGFMMAADAFRRLKKKLDYAEYGAAPLLGVAGYAFICHGRSNAKAIKNALLRTQAALKTRFVEQLESALAVAADSRTKAAT